MVKVGSPLMSESASGKIGERLVFSKRASGQQARFQRAQKDVVTADRTIQRDKYKFAVVAWNVLIQGDKNVYNLRAKNLQMSGYNLFIKEFLVTPPPPVYFDISSSAGANGSVSPSGIVSVLQGANQTFNFSANTDYSISSVFVDGVSQGAISSYTFNNVQANHTVSVSFVLIYDTNAYAFFNAISGGGGNLTTTAKNAINTLVLSLKSYSLWPKMSAIYPIVGGSAISHKFNLKDPRDLDVAFRLSYNSTFAHTSNGIKGTSVSSYCNTYLTPSSSLFLNSTHVSVYSLTDSNLLNCEIGCANASFANRIQLLSRYNGYFYGVINSSLTNAIKVVSNSLGFSLTSRTTSTKTTLFRNATNLGFSSDVSNSMPNFPIVLLGISVGGVISQNSSRVCCWFSIGAGLTDSESLNYYNIVQAYQTTLGRQV